MKKTGFFKVLLIFLGILASTVTLALAPPTAALAFVSGEAPQPVDATLAPVNQDFGGSAINGYDTVAYFTEGEALYGSEKFTHRWRGATWYFVSERHRRLFAADPVRYAPQYGGYCAYAMSHGYAVAIDPSVWTIVDGKLYLNKRYARADWLTDIAAHIASADRVWQGLAQSR